MPIPEFDHNGVLPPYIGEEPTTFAGLSPYKCSTLEFCKQFSTTKRRRDLLLGFLNFRKDLDRFNVIEGFQWVDGSFLEDKENRYSDPGSPNDIDLVTFFHSKRVNDEAIKAHFKSFIDSEISKKEFYIDHYNVDLNGNSLYLVTAVRFWIQLFSHNRDGVWKGMLEISLDTPSVDALAFDYLTNQQFN